MHERATMRGRLLGRGLRRGMARALAALVATLLGGGAAHAKPRAQLTEAAAALLAREPVFVVGDDNVAIPLGARGKPVPLLQAAPKRLEVLSASPSGEALLSIDEDLYRLRGAELALVTAGVGTQPPAVSADGRLVVAVDDRKTLKLIAGGVGRPLRYMRSGRWEFERPYLVPDGSRALVALRDYTQPLDEYSLVVVDTKTLATDEVSLSKTFIPGALRQPIGDAQVALQMYTQGTDDDGVPVLRETDLVSFDLRTRKLGPLPATVRPGRRSPSGRYSLLEGTVRYGEDKRCGGDETRLYEEGKEPVSFKVGDAEVVSALDFLPDERGLVAAVLDLKRCRARGVIIPLRGDVSPARWAPFALPAHVGRLSGRVVHPVTKK